MGVQDWGEGKMEEVVKNDQNVLCPHTNPIPQMNIIMMYYKYKKKRERKSKHTGSHQEQRHRAKDVSQCKTLQEALGLTPLPKSIKQTNKQTKTKHKGERPQKKSNLM